MMNLPHAAGHALSVAASVHADAAGAITGVALAASRSWGFRLEQLHEDAFYVLYAMCAIVTFVVVDRLIYFAYARRHALKLERALKPGVMSFDEVPQNLLHSRAPVAAALTEVRERMPYLRSRGDLEDATDTAFIHAKHRLHQNLWLLDTIITAAPLVGLLGTILGIIETFQILAQSGISDPAAVSKGIGVALFATALGIATALYALLFHNVFQAQLTRILDLVKIVLMRVGFAQRQGEAQS